jgi:hypothetical protein
MNDKDRGLKFDICGFPTSHAFNDDSPDIDKRIKNISTYLSYFCRFWAEHLQEIASETHLNSGPLLQGLREFLDNRLLCWLEVMSLLGCVDVAATELALLAKWCRVSAPTGGRYQQITQLFFCFRHTKIHSLHYQKILSNLLRRSENLSQRVCLTYIYLRFHFGQLTRRCRLATLSVYPIHFPW